jgi:hypothetical protein
LHRAQPLHKKLSIVASLECGRPPWHRYSRDNESDARRAKALKWPRRIAILARLPELLGKDRE